ncbi:phosphoribosylanthranilate isomerase [Sphingobacterium sp. HJSM2_6]|uniref:phosphoribosylanthranilate isomerase n=1 Tax=Sphingobacterium sp. HJSM2_6 TaxID=3366264 RepID=UPI003BCEB00B
MPNKTFLVKVCGMREPANIAELSTLPIDYMGHIFYAKSPRYATSLDHQLVPKHIKKTGVFVNASLEEILQNIAQFDLQAVQLHGDEEPNLLAQLKSYPVELIKSFGITDDFTWSALEPYQDLVDYFLFDTKSKDYGGTGVPFNWEKLTSYPYKNPYFLSGGLSLENLEKATLFEDHRLIGFDLNSKFEIEPGIKNIEKLKEALNIIHHEQISSK